MKQVCDHLKTLNSLCLVLGVDFRHITGEIHSTLNDPKETKDVSDNTIKNLASAVQSLREIKIHRIQRVCICISFIFFLAKKLFHFFLFFFTFLTLGILPASKSGKCPSGVVESDG